MIVKLLAEHHLEFLSLKRGCRGSSESTNVKMQHCWKSHALAHIRSRKSNKFLIWTSNNSNVKKCHDEEVAAANKLGNQYSLSGWA